MKPSFGNPISWCVLISSLWIATENARGETSVYLTGVPDYQWYAGCFGTATGNLIGFWDRHGFPNFYQGPTNKGLAPLNSNGPNRDITALWASETGIDGRPFNQPGHMDDYYIDYESASPDPYTLVRRTEHAPDCIGDFIGLNQDKWQNLSSECDGNLDGYSFVFWDYTGRKRTNFNPTDESGRSIPDIQSGLRSWATYKGYHANSFSQLSDFNTSVPSGNGFRFEDLKSEIDRGYPVLLFMQAFQTYSRTVQGRDHVNPTMHGMLAYGYLIEDDGTRYVRYRTSWASGDFSFSVWNSDNWTPEGILNLPLRGVIGFHPVPTITSATPVSEGLKLQWHAPRSVLFNEGEKTSKQPQSYAVEWSSDIAATTFQPTGIETQELEATVPARSDKAVFYRIRILER